MKLSNKIVMTNNEFKNVIKVAKQSTIIGDIIADTDTNMGMFDAAKIALGGSVTRSYEHTTKLVSTKTVITFSKKKVTVEVSADLDSSAMCNLLEGYGEILSVWTPVVTTIKEQLVTATAATKLIDVKYQARFEDLKEA